MKSTHHFKVQLDWEKTENRKTFKNHQIKIEGKPILDVSAAKSFKGDETLYNPEDLLLSSLTSCHMMSYLYCCALEGINVISYNDQSEAILEVNENGSGRITKVLLKPEVVIAEKEKINIAKELHHKANNLCFIANSCNFEVEHNAVVYSVIR